MNVAFALAFVLCGEDALVGFAGKPVASQILDAFFFSVQTFTTVGYGAVIPNSFIEDV